MLTVFLCSPPPSSTIGFLIDRLRYMSQLTYPQTTDMENYSVNSGWLINGLLISSSVAAVPHPRSIYWQILLVSTVPSSVTFLPLPSPFLCHIILCGNLRATHFSFTTTITCASSTSIIIPFCHCSAILCTASPYQQQS